jgi:hypothetical protein
VELPNIKQVELQTLDQWFSTLVDTVNYDLQTIQAALVTLGQQVSLTTVDTAPIQYLKDSLNELVSNLNDSFSTINDAISSLDERITALGG